MGHQGQHATRKVGNEASWIGRLLCTSLGFLAARAAAQSPLPPPGFGIVSVAYQGTGCAPGTVTTQVSPDGQALTVMFSDYAIDTSSRGGRPARKVCQLNLGLRRPEGWSLAVSGMQVRGYAALQSGAIGVAKAMVSFGRMPHQEVGRQRLIGPFDDNFAIETRLSPQEAEWTSCTQGHRPRLNMRTAISVRPRQRFLDTDGESDDPGRGQGFPQGLVTIDSVDGAIAQRYALTWRRCVR